MAISRTLKVEGISIACAYMKPGFMKVMNDALQIMHNNIGASFLPAM